MTHTSLSSRLLTVLIGIALISGALASAASAHHGTVPQAKPTESSHRVNWLHPGIGAALGAGMLLTVVTRRRSRHARRTRVRAVTS
jgi:hypothetical protein